VECSHIKNTSGAGEMAQRFQSIKEGNQDKKSNRNWKTGTEAEAEAMEECCLLA